MMAMLRILELKLWILSGGQALAFLYHFTMLGVVRGEQKVKARTNSGQMKASEEVATEWDQFIWAAANLALANEREADPGALRILSRQPARCFVLPQAGLKNCCQAALVSIEMEF